MKRTNALSRFLVLSMFLLSCNLLQSPKSVDQSAFPLRQKWAVRVDDDIYAIVASDDWIITATLFDLTAIDPKSGEVLWTKKFDIDVDSELLLSDETLLAPNSTSLKFIEKSGAESGAINFDTQMGSFEVVAIVEHYVFVIRKPTWTLEVYDTSSMKLIRSTSIERGGISIYHGNVSGVAYIATLDGISAVNLSDGDVLWQINKKIVVSDYVSGNIYYIGREDNGDSAYISALNAIDGTETWRRDIFVQGSMEIFNLKSLNKSIIATSQTGLIAFEKDSGNQLWQSQSRDQFPTDPILFNNVIYIKGPLSRTIYAISPDDGSTTSYLQFDDPALFSQSANEYNSRIYLCGGTIVFSGTNMVYGYGN